MDKPIRGSVEAMIQIATAEIGYHEGKDNATKYQTAHQPWCGAFLNFCSDANGIKHPDVTSTIAGASAFKKAGKWFDTDPRPGDFAFFDFIDDGVTKIQHIELVVKVSEGAVVTIGGNVSDAVKLSTHKLGAHSVIVGYGRPDYRTETK